MLINRKKLLVKCYKTWLYINHNVIKKYYYKTNYEIKKSFEDEI